MTFDDERHGYKIPEPTRFIEGKPGEKPKFRYWVVVFKGGPTGVLSVTCAIGEPELLTDGTVLRVPFQGQDEFGHDRTSFRNYPLSEIAFYEEVITDAPPPGFEGSSGRPPSPLGY